MNIAIATGNKDKFTEFQALFGKKFNLSQLEIELIEIQTLDLFKIAEYKLHQVARRELKMIDYVVIDDTALCIEALNGLPGPFIKFFLTQLKPNGIYELLNGRSKIARAICMLGLFNVNTGEKLYFKGEVLGEILAPTTEAFGWDALFKPLRSKKSFAQMKLDEKNNWSHRSHAVKNLIRYLDQLR